MDLLSSLVDKSLVLAEEKDGSVRYRMLETVRAYAVEKLQEAGEEQALRGKHADWYMALSEEADPKLAGPEQGEWLNVLDTEYDNLRSALQESLSRPQGSEGSLRLCGALQRFWWTRGYLAEGREWSEAALARNQAIDGTAARAKVLNGPGALAWYQGDYAVAGAYHEQSLEIFRDIGSRRGVAYSLEAFASLASSSNSIDALSAETATAPENAGFDLQRAPRLWGASQALREQIGAPLPQKEHEEQTERLAKARVKLGETELDYGLGTGTADVAGAMHRLRLGTGRRIADRIARLRHLPKDRRRCLNSSSISRDEREILMAVK